MKKRFACIWIFFHAAVISAFLISLAFSPEINFATSLFDILPPSSSLHEVQSADAALASKTGRAVTVLAKGETFEKAKFKAAEFYSHYVDSENRLNADYFDSLSLYVNSNSVAEITYWLFKNRYNLIDDETCELLENGGAEEVAEEALASVYGAFSFSDLSVLEEDPFLLTERSLKRFLEGGALSSTSMSLHDEVLAAQKDGLWYVLIRGVISEKGAALTGKNSTVRNIYSFCDKDQFVFSGVPFHSYESSASAQTQISVISTISLILIIVTFLFIFRSFMPAFISALAVVFSCGIGFISVLLFFRGIHVLTFVFGTTLIGTCLDYSIHYFVNWKGNSLCRTGEDVRNHIFRGITLGFVSTEICFAALFFAPFPLLKQVSVFLFMGLLASYLTVIAVYPLLKNPELKGIAVPKLINFQNNKKTLCRYKKFVPFVLVIFSVSVILINYRSFGIKNNIKELYSMSDQMLQNEIMSAKVLNTGSSGWYFIVKADSEEELLQKNEELAEFLNSAVNEKKLGNYLSVVQFIPSQKKQRKSYLASEKLLPLAESQFEVIGFGNNSDNYENNYRSLEHGYITPSDSDIPASIKEAVSNLWIGKIGDKFYSCVLPLHASADEEIYFREYASKNEGIFFVNKVKDISAQLDVLSKTMLLMLLFAFIVVIIVLCFCYRLNLVIKIAAIPFMVTVITTAVLFLCRINLSFFPITALVLIFGLGLDYIIYMVEGIKNKAGKTENLNNFAIVLSFFTTALSFGALAFSSFAPVHMLGLTVFAGLSAAVLSAFCLTED
ncbi:MMPL family transporter [Treponema sp.]|uniref:MMPL family transporter n=1 Tax=Treponema sp. TaxID=166 RepID=UPI00388ED44A